MNECLKLGSERRGVSVHLWVKLIPSDFRKSRVILVPVG
jgi:hypothetical protein